MAFLNDQEWENFTSNLKNFTIIYDRLSWIDRPLEIFGTFMYAFLFIIGLASNLWVLKVIGTVLKRCSIRSVNVLIYIGSLALIDLIILASVPMAILDMIFGQWMLPAFLCPWYWVVESLNKTISSLILACLTVSCYCAVCQPRMERMYKCTLVAFLHIFGCLLIVGWKARPFFSYSNIYHLIEIFNSETIVNFGSKCTFHPPKPSDTYYLTLDAFFVTFLSPMFYMICFYGAILRTILKQSRCLSRNNPPRHFWRVAKSASILVGFYFLTWTPYWGVTLALSMGEENFEKEEILSMMAFFVHLLPLANCALSPLLYTLTNKHVRTLYKTANGAKEQKNRFHRLSTRRTKGIANPIL